MKVFVAASARLDLLEIGDYIRPHNPERVTTKQVEIMHVLHGAQECDSLLFPGN